jgi:adenylate cyclase
MSHNESAQRAALMRIFSRNVSKELAESLWRNRDAFLDGSRPRTEAMTVTALFTDLMGFTTVSERLGPEALMKWLNEYMAPMTELVSRHGGVLRQYAGDAIVALFGIPVARRTSAEIAQDAVNAVQCALAMAAELRNLNRRWDAVGAPMTGMRVGVFTGPVVAGTIGTDERSEYVVVGDTMNTASRLESYDKELFPPDLRDNPCRILIGATTWEYLGGQVRCERVGDVMLKGKEQSVSVYHVLGWCNDAAVAVREEATL